MSDVDMTWQEVGEVNDWKSWSVGDTIKVLENDSDEELVVGGVYDIVEIDFSDLEIPLCVAKVEYDPYYEKCAWLRVLDEEPCYAGKYIKVVQKPLETTLELPTEGYKPNIHNHEETLPVETLRHIEKAINMNEYIKKSDVVEYLSGVHTLLSSILDKNRLVTENDLSRLNRSTKEFISKLES